ncbi:MAG: hypothetical protein HPY85_09620 [Anaerolineae bacterium]|nr:hypothetical protein [Anaerolineae bacterium]
MKTPAGKECSYFYGNYYRGAHQEECRLLGNRPGPSRWTPDLCGSCPVPEIQRANACANMVLTAEVKRVFFAKRRVVVSAYCKKTHQFVDEPRIGCGHCNELPDIFELPEK